ncbi:hypothetical protein AALP_AAs46524U000300 [Arabis alpina]|uniref:ER membrane protein complex subunit 7 beta-sandwich domain-containing protein n=1 Tax=Arabis alpina TaxID=50452 RepID=A0A087FXY2_ARAAL|nr:hypothetical protein AALP_AAs46524U000300 [Arabis alpina]
MDRYGTESVVEDEIHNPKPSDDVEDDDEKSQPHSGGGVDSAGKIFVGGLALLCSSCNIVKKESCEEEGEAREEEKDHLKGTAIGHAAKFSNIKVVLNGGQSITFLRPDGFFTFHKVPAGTHLIEVYALGYFFSPVRVHVSARHRGKVQATLTETRRSLFELVLEPLRAEQYYEGHSLCFFSCYFQ